ncbi:MAG: dipeptide/tripeptide permease [Amphiamblys sp. WSBS2006]|nr:MAG: dipeptide/tripeptide permease [Amphiamblys sp. WSBS2006]
MGSFPTKTVDIPGACGEVKSFERETLPAVMGPSLNRTVGMEETAEKRKTGQGGFTLRVFFIVFVEFCERISFFGLRLLLPSYLNRRLFFTEKSTTITVHLFSFGCFFSPLLGGVLSDNLLGRYRTIVSFLCVFFVGACFLFFSAVYEAGSVGCLCGLALVAAGTGGIKPCISSFGADQFPRESMHLLPVFFSVFYVVINVGSMISMCVIPLVTNSVSCFGRDQCYPLGFGIPAALIGAALFCFVLFSGIYVRREATGGLFCGIVGAWWCSVCSKKGNALFWMNAAPEYSEEFLQDVMRLMSLLGVISPLVFFWALYEQQGSSWVFQGKKLDGGFMLFSGSFTVYAEQMLVLNTVLVIVLVPVVEKWICPFFGRYFSAPTLFGRMRTGMVFGVVSFLCAAVLEAEIMKRGAGRVSLLWQIPQFFFMALAEVLVAVPGLSLVYTEAPETMKSLCLAGWFMAIAFGNIIVIFFEMTETASFGEERKNIFIFSLYAGLLGVFSVVFVLLSSLFEARSRESVSKDGADPRVFETED